MIKMAIWTRFIFNFEILIFAPRHAKKADFYHRAANIFIMAAIIFAVMIAGHILSMSIIYRIFDCQAALFAGSLPS